MAGKQDESELVEVNVILPYGPQTFMVPGGLRGPVDGVRWMKSPYSNASICLVGKEGHGIFISLENFTAISESLADDPETTAQKKRRRLVAAA